MQIPGQLSPAPSPSSTSLISLGLSLPRCAAIIWDICVSIKMHHHDTWPDAFVLTAVCMCGRRGVVWVLLASAVLQQWLYLSSCHTSACSMLHVPAFFIEKCVETFALACTSWTLERQVHLLP